MTSTVLRKKIQGCLDGIDERHLKAIYSYLKDFTEDEYEIDATEKKLLDSRRNDLKSGKVKGISLEEVNKRLSVKKKK